MWNKKKLGELCLIKSGDSNARDADDNGKYALFDRSKKIKKSKRFLFDCEALIIPGEGKEFLPRYYKGKFDLHQRAYAIHQFKPELNIQYLFYYLVHNKNYFSEVAVGATVKSLRQRHFDNLEVYYPAILEQQRIVAELDVAFTEINKIKLNIKNKTALSKKLFIKFLDTTFQNSKYKSIKIGDIIGVHSGGTPSTTNKDYWNGTIPWYSSRELNDYKTKDSVKKITKLALKKSNAKIFPKNTLLVGIYDTAAMKMSILHQEGTFNQAIVGIPPNLKLETEYLFFLLNYKKDEILIQRRGVRQLNLSLAKIKDINIPKPTLEEQISIINSCNAFKEKTKNFEKFLVRKLYLLDSLKNSILNQKLNNKVA